MRIYSLTLQEFSSINELNNQSDAKMIPCRHGIEIDNDLWLSYDALLTPVFEHFQQVLDMDESRVYAAEVINDKMQITEPA